MASGDVLKLISKQTYLGQDVYNVYHYLQNGNTVDASDLIVDWKSVVLPAIRAIQAPALVHNEVEVINLDDPADFAVDSFTAAGTAPTNGTHASFTCWSFILNRATRAIRNGGKRFAGVVEEDVASNEPTAAALVRLVSCASALANRVDNLASGDYWDPVIIRRGHPLLPDVTALVVDAAFKRLSTQRSRLP